MAALPNEMDAIDPEGPGGPEVLVPSAARCRGPARARC